MDKFFHRMSRRYAVKSLLHQRSFFKMHLGVLRINSFVGILVLTMFLQLMTNI